MTKVILKEERSLYNPTARRVEFTESLLFCVMKYFAYARKSTEHEERQQLSIEAQVFELKKFAASQGLNIVEILTEKKSAKQPGRPVFGQMLKRINNGEAEGILSWHPDRLSRNAVDAGKIFHLLDTEKLKDLKFPSFWFEPTPQGMLMLNLAFSQAKYLIDNLAVNTKRGLLHKARQGWLPSTAPRGYLNDTRNKTIFIDKETAPHIKKLFELYSTGKHSLINLRLFLAKKGIVSSNLKPLSPEYVRQILMNPFYYGHFRYGGELYEGKHEPLITKKLFDKVQETLHRKGPNKSNTYARKKHHFPFVNLFTCGECGYSITAEQHIKKSGLVFRYYRCSKAGIKRGIRCSQPYINEKRLFPQLTKFMQKVSLPDDWVKKMIDKIGKEEREAAQSSKVLVRQLKDQIEKIDLKINNLLDLHLEGSISRKLFLTKKNNFLSQRKSLEKFRRASHQQRTSQE